MASQNNKDDGTFDSGFLFVDATHMPKDMKKGRSRHEARAWLMRRARKERPWSTSKRKTAISKSRISSSSTLPSAPIALHPSGMPGVSSETDQIRSKPKAQDAGVLLISQNLVPSDYGESILSRQNFNPISIKLHDNHNGDCKDCVATRLHGGTFCQTCSYLRITPRSYDHEVDKNKISDPFALFSIPFDCKSERLLLHWQEVLAPGGMPIDDHQHSSRFQAMNLDIAKTSAAAMHAILYCSALHFVVTGRGSPVDAVFHKTRAVAEVNKAIASSSRGLNNGTIYATLSLLCMEEIMYLPDLRSHFSVRENEKDAIELYYSGLKKMVELRGGIQGLNDSEDLQALILWHETAVSLVSLKPSSIDFSTLEQRLELCLDAHESSMTLELAKIIPHDEDIKLIAEISTFIPVLQRWLIHRPGDLDPIRLQNKACLFQLRLIRLVTQLSLRSTSSFIKKSLFMSVLGFVSCVSDTELRKHHPMEVSALAQLRITLLRTSMHQWRSASSLLVWILTIGGICARQSPVRKWFVAQVKATCRQLSIESYQQYMECVKSLLWLEQKLDSAAMRLWDESQDSEVPHLTDLDMPTGISCDAEIANSVEYLSLPVFAQNGGSHFASGGSTGQTPSTYTSNLRVTIEAHRSCLDDFSGGRFNQARKPGSPTIGDTLVRYHKSLCRVSSGESQT